MISLDLIALIQGCILAAMVAGVVGLFRMANRLARLIEWSENHEKSDDHRHAENLARFSEIFHRLKKDK